MVGRQPHWLSLTWRLPRVPARAESPGFNPGSSTDYAQPWSLVSKTLEANSQYFAPFHWVQPFDMNVGIQDTIPNHCDKQTTNLSSMSRRQSNAMPCMDELVPNTRQLPMVCYPVSAAWTMSLQSPCIYLHL